MTIPRPLPDEHNAYFGIYIAGVPGDHVLDQLDALRGERRALLAGVDDARAATSYEPGKWSLKQVLGHLLDCERVFLYRALSAARGDDTPLPGFDQDAWVAGSRFDEQSLEQLLDDLDRVRERSLAFFSRLSPEELLRRTSVEGSAVSVRAVPWLLAGHERHHLKVLRSRYL